MAETVDVVVVGAGIVGLSIARELLLREPALRLVVLEKEQEVGQHASGRNSGVLHAGFYYAPDSLKARLTRRGNEMLRGFIHSQDLPLRESGKVVVATTESELATLDMLADRGAANGVELEMVDTRRLSELEPMARTVDRALWSPRTAVSDPLAVTQAIARSVVELGGQLRLGEPVQAARPGSVSTASSHLFTGHVINASGLHADRVAESFGMCDDYRMLPFKGLYWYGSWPAGRLRRHVYPVPDPRNPFLGVHLTVTVDGRTKIGPTAIPALWREDYGGLHGFEGRDLAEIAGLYPRFLKSPHHDALGLVRAEVPKYWRRHLVKQASRLVPAARPADFAIRGRVGVRAQLFHLPTRSMEMDFVVRGDQHSTHMLNAVSPAWTSALAVAEHVVPDILSRMGREYAPVPTI